MQALIPRMIEGEVVRQRVRDGCINATAMCKAAGKLWGHYHENETSKAFLMELEADIGIPISELVQSVKGGFPDMQGTWVPSLPGHPFGAGVVATICGSCQSVGSRVDDPRPARQS